MGRTSTALSYTHNLLLQKRLDLRCSLSFIQHRTRVGNRARFFVDSKLQYPLAHTPKEVAQSFGVPGRAKRNIVTYYYCAGQVKVTRLEAAAGETFPLRSPLCWGLSPCASVRSAPRLAFFPPPPLRNR